MEGTESYYTPERIDRWVRDWLLLESLAETPRSSRHYLTLEHRYLRGRPCSEAVHPEQRVNSYHGDELSYADIQADIESAWNDLGPTTLESRVVYLVMQSYTIRQIADMLRPRVSSGTAHHRYWDGVNRMSAQLSGVMLDN